MEQVATLQSEAVILTSCADSANAAYEKLRGQLEARIRSSKQKAPGQRRRSEQVGHKSLNDAGDVPLTLQVSSLEGIATATLNFVEMRLREAGM